MGTIQKTFAKRKINCPKKRPVHIYGSNKDFTTPFYEVRQENGCFMELLKLRTK